MTTDDALLHETSQKHISNIPPPDPVVLSDWDTPQNAVDGWLDPPPEADDKQFFICRMTGFIPFWVRGVEAAAEGGYLRLEDYLNDVEKANLIAWEASRRDIIGHQQRSSDFHLENWSQNSNNGWGNNNNGWGNDGWKVDDQGWGNIKGDDLPSAHRSAWPLNVQDTLPELASDSDCSGHVLVERVAKSRAASPEKAQRLRSFFDVCMLFSSPDLCIHA